MIRVFIADDHEIVREGLIRLVSECRDMSICGDSPSGAEVIRRAKTEVWDVLVLDISMPDINGIEIIQQMKSIKPETRIVVFTMYKESSLAVRVLRSGAKGFLSKDRPPKEVLEAIRKVYRGGRYITPALAEYLFERDIDLKKDPHQTMSDREYEVFILLGKGMKPIEIASHLKLGYSTITTYVHRIKNKLSVNSIGEIVQYAFRHGLTD